ncbi:hypothetical protein P4278_08775, partial [Bacillus thuringiensis]|nr:hypothetical protein [Bacillus thuringiensis]
MKKQAITVIATVLTYFLFSNVGHAQEKPKQYYTVLLKDPSKLDQGITEIKKKDGEITYTVPEIGLIQFKGDTQVSTNQSPLFESVNPSLQVETPEISHSIKIPNLSNFSTKTLDTNLPPSYDEVRFLGKGFTYKPKGILTVV